LSGGAWLILRIAAHNERGRIYRTAWVTIHLAEPIDGLDSVSFDFGGEVHNYSIEQLVDTVGENMLLEDKPDPFAVRYTYHFRNGRTAEISTDTFDCRRCSGGHAYGLHRDSVAYRYWP
jgi:hypothetical protein